MKLKKVNKDPFSNGHEFDVFDRYNCSHCIKSSRLKADCFTFTNADENNMPKCSIQRDIIIRMADDTPIKQETIDICENFTLMGIKCPYMKTKWKTYKKQVINQQELSL